MQKWADYYDTLISQPNSDSIGRNLEDESSLSPAQREQLSKLKSEVERASLAEELGLTSNVLDKLSEQEQLDFLTNVISNSTKNQ